MPFSVNTNTNALAALQTLNQTQRSLTATGAHINTGFKINDARDNASTFAIAQGMRADISGLKAVQDSLSLGQATLTVANNAVKQIQDQLTDLQGKVVQGQNATVDKTAVQNGINAILNNINSIANAAQFNGVNLINSSTGSFSVTSSLNRTSSTSVSVATVAVNNSDLTASGGVLGLGGLSILSSNSTSTLSLGTNPAIADEDKLVLDFGTSTITFEFNQSGGTLASTSTATDKVVAVNFLATDTVGTKVANLAQALRQNGFTATVADNGDLTVSANQPLNAVTGTFTTGTIAASAPSGNPAAALTAVNQAINNIKSVAANLGTAYNQLQSQNDFVKSLTDTLTGGVSTLVDADLAEESATLQALQTRQQLGIQALSIANQSSGVVLSLFR
jgi:flagellin